MSVFRWVKMMSQPGPDKTRYLATIAVQMETALGELHHYRRFGRHLKGFDEKAYLILSRCGFLLSSLLMAEQEAPSGIVDENPALGTLFDKLDWEALRDCGYRWRGFYAGNYTTDLTDGPKWCRLWRDVLEHLGTTRASDIKSFPECLLKCVAGDESFGKKLTRKERKALAELLRSPQAGWLFLDSTRILEDLIASVGDFLAQLDAATHVIEQVQLLTCLLSQVRRTIVYESEVRGPYAMPEGLGWEPGPVRLHVSRSNALGLLTVVATEESGELACTYISERSGRTKERSWSRTISALPHDYEEMLFKTWCYETGDHYQIVDLFGQAKARWVVRSAEADQLETICGHVDTLLDRLGTLRECHAASEYLAHVARRDQRRWTRTELPWTFVRDLDTAISKLRLACREAVALDGGSSTVEVITSLWPPESFQPHAGAAAVSEEPFPECEMSRDETVALSDAHSPTGETPVVSLETQADSGTPGQMAVSTEQWASGDQDHVLEGQKTDTDHDAANGSAMATAQEDAEPQATSPLTESSESGIVQTAGDGAVGGPSKPMGKAAASTEPSSEYEMGRDQNQPRSSQTNGRRRLTKRRAEKLATTMNILLGESVDDKGTGSPSSP